MDRKWLTAALAVGVLAVILSCTALVAALRDDGDDHVETPRDEGRAEAVGDLAREMESLKGDIARLSSTLEELAARADRSAAPAKIDPAEVGRLVDERMRESIVMATGRARMRPDAAAIMRRQMDATGRVYALLLQRTGIRVPELERLLIESSGA